MFHFFNNLYNMYRFSILPFFILLSGTLFSTTIIPHLHLGEAAQYSQAVVVARAEYLIETLENGTTYFDTRLKLDAVLKGPLAVDQEITIRALSNRTGTLSYDVVGDFMPTAGSTYLLFLEQFGAVWRPRMLIYYVFEQQTQKGTSFWVPLADNGGIETVERPDGQQATLPCVYKQAALLQSIKKYLFQIPGVWDDTAAKATNWEAGVADRVIPVDCDFQIGSSPLTRCVNSGYSMYYINTGIPPNWASNYAATLSTLNSNYSVGIVDGGATNFTANCVGGSASGNTPGNNFPAFISSLNGNQSGLIIFDDPCNQLSNLVGCAGTVALGGSYRNGITHVYDGQNWDSALWASVTINNGISCMSDANFRSMLTHEITHTYRMDHLSAATYPLQNMNPMCCNNISTKDMECMNYAYNNAPAPVELATFEAKVLENKQVKLQWTTVSEKNNDYYTLERSVDGTRFSPLAKIKAKESGREARYDWTDKQPLDGTDYYRLSQTDRDGTTKMLGIKSVRIESAANTVSIFPNPATDEMTINTNFSDYFDGHIEIINSEGKIVFSKSVQVEKGPQVARYSLSALSKGAYFVRWSDARFNATQRLIKY